MSWEALHWSDYLKAIGPSLIALFVAYIAFQQWQVNRANLRERLFDRRFEVFRETQNFLSSVLRDAKVSNEALAEFQEAPQIARFLFDEKLAKYLSEIRNHAIDLQMHHEISKEPTNEEKRLDAVGKKHEEIKWLIAQLPVIFDKFEPFLGFKNHN